MTMTLPDTKSDTTLFPSEQDIFDAIVEDVIFDATIGRLTPNLCEVEISPVFYHNPAFLREIPIQGRSRVRIAKLVEATEIILAHPQLGLSAVRTARIARIAGCSIGTFYRYFEDETAILDYVFPDRVVHLPTGS